MGLPSPTPTGLSPAGPLYPRLQHTSLSASIPSHLPCLLRLRDSCSPLGAGRQRGPSGVQGSPRPPAILDWAEVVQPASSSATYQ